MSLNLLPAWLRSLEARIAVGPIQLVSDVAAHGEAQLRHGRVQCLLCHGHERAPTGLDPAGITSCEVGRDDLLPVCAPDAQGLPRFDLDAAPRRGAGAWPFCQRAWSVRTWPLAGWCLPAARAGPSR